MNMGKYTLVLSGLAFTVALNSCYFNSAGKIVDKASYKALSTTSDIAQNQLIYCKGGQYYIELPRYRNEKPAKLHYSITDDEDKTKYTPTLVRNAKDMFRIPQDFALYLAGKAKGPKTPSEMVLQQDGEEIKKSADSTMKIVRTADKYSLEHKYRSPNAPWLWTAAVFDWLCVDLPITLVENSLVISGMAAYTAFAVLSTSDSDSSSSSSSGSYSGNVCSVCNGTGYFGTRTVNEETRRDDFNIYYETKTYREPCYRCGGSGRKSDEERTINNAKGSMLDSIIFGETSKNGSFMGNFL